MGCGARVQPSTATAVKAPSPAAPSSRRIPMSSYIARDVRGARRVASRAQMMGDLIIALYSMRIVSFAPFGLGHQKPHHYWEMLRILWENRDSLSYAWRILKHG